MGKPLLRTWSPHRWQAIGHVGDGNEYLVWLCKDCGCRATTPDNGGPDVPPDDKKYPACTVEPVAPKPVKKRKPRKTAWDKLLADDDLGGDITEAAVMKTAINVVDSDLVTNESNVLEHLFSPWGKAEKFHGYLPRIYGRFNHEGQPANLIRWAEGYVSLADILKAYPEGIDYRDLAWMFKRALVGVGFAHYRGVIHGCIIPSHIAVHPTGHGAKLFDWCYSVMLKDRRSIPAYVAAWKAYYPPEVFKKWLPTSATDIYMVAACAVALLGGDVEHKTIPLSVPVEVRDLLQRCMREKPSKRPQSAWDLHEEFDEILLKLIGKPRYRPFSMPRTT